MLNRYIIERKINGVGAGTDKDLSNMTGKSNEALTALGAKIQWIKSSVTDDKVYCEYLAQNEGFAREHAKLGGFSADSVLEVKYLCDPTTSVDDFAGVKGEMKKTPDRESFLTS